MHTIHITTKELNSIKIDMYYQSALTNEVVVDNSYCLVNLIDRNPLDIRLDRLLEDM